MNNQPIGVFDSGVGGLSVLRELKKLLPNETYIFVADQKNVPYGGKTKDQLIQFSDSIVDFLVTKKKVKAVVIACNTSTVYSIGFLRSKYKIPIIGTVPVIKTIANLTKSGKTAVFSTPATAKSQYLSDLIKKFADGIIVYKVSGTGLEDLVEEGNLKSPKINKILHKSLIPLKEKGVDSIALGCTHYPFLRDQIEAMMGSKVGIVDSGSAVARHTREVLTKENLLGNLSSEDYFYTTGNRVKFKKALKNLLDLDTERIYNLNL
ncbi:MAG: glutamate racemase [Candidatus Levybacteria bacterium CG_4_9_14_3_um_filter_35_16]|nr:MAG: glutamate racemase [Candidatus Levybacteria bacterium CG_4_9_14_3_um_filter_35_16]PJC54722.1 MAG: glutamate racemase [Candidatus Levybacteria bacterium CG_4_9_14_0_2_um_filter_35_21]